MKAKSCTFALDNVVDQLSLKLDENYIAYLVLLAFGTIDHNILLKKLQTLFNFSK